MRIDKNHHYKINHGDNSYQTIYYYMIENNKVVKKDVKVKWHWDNMENPFRFMMTELRDMYPDKNILEISSFSKPLLGREINPFQLKSVLNPKIPVAHLFYMSKIYEDDELIGVEIWDKEPCQLYTYVKKRLTSKAHKEPFIGYKYKDYFYTPEQGYLWFSTLYLHSLERVARTSANLKEYDIFTDITHRAHRVDIPAEICANYALELKRGNKINIPDFIKENE